MTICLAVFSLAFLIRFVKRIWLDPGCESAQEHQRTMRHTSKVIVIDQGIKLTSTNISSYKFSFDRLDGTRLFVYFDDCSSKRSGSAEKTEVLLAPNFVGCEPGKCIWFVNFKHTRHKQVFSLRNFFDEVFVFPISIPVRSKITILLLFKIPFLFPFLGPRLIRPRLFRERFSLDVESSA